MAMPLTPVTLGTFANRFRSAAPFPHIVVDNFIDGSAARTIAAEYPTFENARALGFTFSAVNERKKIQITDHDRFPPAVRYYTKEPPPHGEAMHGTIFRARDEKLRQYVVTPAEQVSRETADGVRRLTGRARRAAGRVRRRLIGR